MDGTENPDDQLTELFAAHRRCFDQHVGLLDPPAIPIAVPCEDSDLPGYLLVPADDGVARPTVILNNGSDGAMTFLWPGLGQPGLDRGYNTVIFDGPGQQSMVSVQFLGPQMARAGNGSPRLCAMISSLR